MDEMALEETLKRLGRAATAGGPNPSKMEPPKVASVTEMPLSLALQCEAIFKVSFDDLCAKYVEGTMTFLEKNQPELAQKIAKSEARCTHLRNEALQGRADMLAFREAVGQWHEENLEGIRIYVNNQEARND